MADFKKKDTFTPTKATCLSIGKISFSKLDLFLQIRQGFIKYSNFFAENSFVENFLTLDTYNKKILSSEYTLPLQKSIKGKDLNKTYIEKARRNVEDHLLEQYKRSIKALFFYTHDVDKINKFSKRQLASFEKKNEIIKKFKYIPIEIQDDVLPCDFDFIKSTFKKNKSYKNKIQWFRDIILNEKRNGLNDIQIKIIKHLYQCVKNRYSMPKYGINDDFDATIHLDYRIIDDYKNKVIKIDQHHNWLYDKNNKHYRLFLEVANPIPHQEKIKLPIAINQAVFNRLIDDNELPNTQSLILIIKHNAIELRSVLMKDEITINNEEKHKQLLHCDTYIGRDFGYKDTISISVIKKEIELSLEEFERRIKLNKEETKAFYQTHTHVPKIIEQVTFSGQKFMKKIKKVSLTIDKLRSHIDNIYNKIEDLKINLSNYLKLEENQLLNETWMDKDIFVNRLMKKFFRLLKIVENLKKKRRNCYKKIKGTKKSWFGYLSNIEIFLAKKYNSAMIVENLTVMAIEKEKPDYKSSSFNKMINNGSKGQYMNMSREKLLWNGIVEVRIPSFYSSKTCVEHSLVEEKKETMRKNKVFKCPKCNKSEDADLHASSTIGSFLLLAPTG